MNRGRKQWISDSRARRRSLPAAPAAWLILGPDASKQQQRGTAMATVPLIEYEHADRKVKAVYNDIRKTRGGDFINNFWKALAIHPELLKRIWREVKQVMAPGALDPLTKEMVWWAMPMTSINSWYCSSVMPLARAEAVCE